MFNVARPAQRYDSYNGLNTSYVADPLASSYAEEDPWSGTGTPALQQDGPSEFTGILGNAQIPPIYGQAFSAVDALGTGSISINALQRVLAASGIPAATIEQIVNMVTSSRSRVTRPEFYVAMALVGLAQQEKDVSLDAVKALALENNLPHPTALDISSLQNTTIKSTFPPPSRGATAANASAAPAYSAESDPWSAPSRGVWPAAEPNANGVGLGPDATSSILGSGLPPQWWKGLERIDVTVHGQGGLFFNRFTVYSVQSFSRGVSVMRRYSEFVFLWDCLVKRYPFRILPQLPPKRLAAAADDSFTEQRRKGLIRFLNFVVNHPIIKEDGVLSAFLIEPDLEVWKRRNTVSYDEEALSKRIDRTEEMLIPRDLEEKLAATRQKIGMLVEQWTRLCTIAERALKRREAAAADIARATLTINALTESNHQDPWGGLTSELAVGVRIGMENTSKHLSSLADTMDQRSRVSINSNLEALKVQRDLYVAVRDLFSRHDRYSPDAADRLKKRIETQSVKLESVRVARKDGWEAEADKIASSIEKDKQAVAVCLARRVFIRHCLWHEFRVVFHNREHALLSVTIQTWAASERDSCETTLGIWNSLVDSVDTMPYE